MDAQRISRVLRSRRQARAAYDRLSSWYDLMAGGLESRPRDAAARMLDLRAGEVVLEIGCGTGRALEAMSRAVGASGRIHGIDISKGMLDVARRRIEPEAHAGSISLQQADALNLPFAAHCFCGVLLSFTLELFDTPEIPLVLAECMRTLRREGRICVLGLSKKGGANTITRVYEWAHARLPQYADCRPIFVQGSLEEAGFRILDAVKLSLGGLQAESVLAQAP